MVTSACGPANACTARVIEAIVQVKTRKRERASVSYLKALSYKPGNTEP
jgi:hypothetical protein